MTILYLLIIIAVVELVFKTIGAKFDPYGDALDIMNFAFPISYLFLALGGLGTIWLGL